ncbi:MAG TPA: flagellar biosynthesis protein [Aquabacterium sp.]|nr:flagellar biosynthesis protein [Aquabacterium sp.]
MIRSDRSTTGSSLGAGRPMDQAHGLRQMFTTRVIRFIPVIANPSAACGGVVLERLCAAYGNFGLSTLVVDASDQARPPSELADFDLSEGIEVLSSLVKYMPARGLPLRHVDARGSCATLLDALANASPQSDVVLIHASASELVRIFGQRARQSNLRPLLFSNDRAEGLTDAYGAIKIFVQRAHWMAYDLVVCASGRSTQADEVARRLGQCADNFLGAAQRRALRLDPAESATLDPSPEFQELAAGLLQSAWTQTLGDTAFDHLVSPGAALPSRVTPVLN